MPVYFTVIEHRSAAELNLDLEVAEDEDGEQEGCVEQEGGVE